MQYFLIFLILVAATLAYRHWSKRAAHKALLATPLSAGHRAIVAQQVPLTRALPANLREGFEGKISAFLDQVDFIGCDGLQVTDEMRLSISAQACLLIANSPAWYTHLRTILVYPGAFKSKMEQRDGYIVTEREPIRLGESWPRGPVVLSWQHSEQGALRHTDGHNVVLHEFAHQIDDLSGHTDGAPNLSKGQSFAEWARVFISAYERHVESITQGRRTLLDAYGDESSVEFFAVAIEVFFEKPTDLKAEEPEIYAQLSDLLHLDPASWSAQ